jgi:hypothetical protein
VLGCVHHLRRRFSEETKGTCSGGLFARGEGALRRRCAPHLGGGHTLRERAQTSREKARVIQEFKWVKNYGISMLKVTSKQRIRIKTSKQEEVRLTKARGVLLHKACGKVFKELQGIRKWFLLYRVHLFMFLVLYILLRGILYISAPNWFSPWRGFFQGHVDQKSLCQIYACLEV